MGSCQSKNAKRLNQHVVSQNTNESDSPNQVRRRINTSKRHRLRNMKVFVLDNSLRESTVGQIVGHSTQDKFGILDATNKCGFSQQVVGCFSTSRRVDDAFASAIQQRNKEFSDRAFYAFVELYEQLDENGCMSKEHIPIGLQKMKTYGIPNAIIEFESSSKFPVSEILEQLAFLLQWTEENLPVPLLGGKRTPFVNLRDFPVAMIECPDRILEVVKGIATMPPSYRPAGMIQEEPIGEYFADEVAGWNQEVRDTMDANGWPSLFQKDGKTLDGLLLSHVHKQWGLADAVVLDVLAAGADGIWCSICEEGAAMGHASSCVTLANLARLGNRDVLSRYQTKNLATAAREVTMLTTNRAVSERQIVYGPRAIETVFGFSGIAGGAAEPSFDKDGDGVIDEVDHFSLSKFLGVDDPPIRISTLSSPDLVRRRLTQCFGDSTEFTEDLAKQMLAKMKEELEDNIEFEHTSPMGISQLYKNTTGSMHPKMMDYDKGIDEIMTHKTEMFLKQAEECFCENLAEGKDYMEYRQFYEAYLQPYFGCFTCPRTRFVLDYIELDQDERLSWHEWRFWCLWALRAHPEQIANLDDLHSVVFRNAIIPLSLQEKTKEIQLEGKKSTMTGLNRLSSSMMLIESEEKTELLG